MEHYTFGDEEALTRGILVCFRELSRWLSYCWGEYGFSSQRWSTILSQTKKLSAGGILVSFRELSWWLTYCSRE